MSEENVPKKRGKYNTKKSKELEKLLEAAKEFDMPNRKDKPAIKYTIEEMTNGVCLYPARYLDNDNSCVTCNLYEHCGCKLKNLGKKGRR
jgi:hypothetical protein